MESAKLTLPRLFYELDLATVSLGGDWTLLSLGMDSELEVYTFFGGFNFF
jgi:hypothetical protein